jgi:hypothetical protein
MPTEILGTDGNDLLIADRLTFSSSDGLVITGLAGDDVIQTLYGLGASGGVTVRGGDGDDKIQIGDLRQTRFVNGNAGNDEIGTPVRSNFKCQGGKGDDIMNIISDANGEPQSGMLINGNMGDDIINYQSLTRVANFTVRGGQGDDIINVENPRIERIDRSYNIKVHFAGDLDDDSFYVNAPQFTCEISIDGGLGVDALRLPLPDNQYFKGFTYEGAAVILNFEYGNKQSSIYTMGIEHVFFGGLEVQI